MWRSVVNAVVAKRCYLFVIITGFTVGCMLMSTYQKSLSWTSRDQLDPSSSPSDDAATQNTQPAALAIHKPEETSRQVQSSHVKAGKVRTRASTTVVPVNILKLMSNSRINNKYYNMNYTHITNVIDSSHTKLAQSLPSIHVDGCDCDKVVAGDQLATEQARQFQKSNPKLAVPDSAYVSLTKNCDKFKQERQYVTTPLSVEESEFPIAYSIMAFKEVEQFERLLRAIYHPQNYYCVHVDKKSPKVVKQAIKAITACFDNVIMASRQIEVHWAWFSVLEPDLICMEDLWQYKKWKYYINLTGQEFPLKTNADLVKILKTYNGANNMEGTEQRRNVERTEFVHDGFSAAVPAVRKSRPADNWRLTKGSVHVTVCRAFVDYVLHDKRALTFRDWVKDTGVPDETFFSTLNHSPLMEVPGAYTGTPETHPEKYPFVTRFKNWGLWPFEWPCAGQRVRLVCVFGVGDLPLLASRPELFANKFYLDYEPLALDCMERLHFQRMKEEILQVRQLDTTYYRSLPFVVNHV